MQQKTPAECCLPTASSLIPCWRNLIFFLFVFCFLFFCFFWCCFLGPHLQHMKVPRLGVPNRSCSHWPTPQHHGTRAASSTYTIAQGNTGSLTHWVRPGMEPASSWLLVSFVSAEPQRAFFFFFKVQVRSRRLGKAAPPPDPWNISLLI